MLREAFFTGLFFLPPCPKISHASERTSASLTRHTITLLQSLGMRLAALHLNMCRCVPSCDVEPIIHIYSLLRCFSPPPPLVERMERPSSRLSDALCADGVGGAAACRLKAEQR